ncbi:MAG: thioredoxin [Anaerolineae bacterium]|nr:MAG: thioredoxin [Anaerolineae bacterium]
MAPIVHGLESEFSGQVNFAYLDIDDAATERFKKALGYRVQPHFFLLDADGNVLNQWVGAVDGETLRTAISEALGQQ